MRAKLKCKILISLTSGAAGCVWMTNGRFSVAIDYTQSNLVNNLDDLQTFFDNVAAVSSTPSVLTVVVYMYMAE